MKGSNLDQPVHWYSIFKDIKFWIPTFISILAVIVSLLPYFRKPEIDGKIGGLIRSGHMRSPYSDQDGTLKVIEGVGYTINIIIECRNKNFSVNNFDVYLKYLGDDNKYKGEIIRAHEIILDVGGTKKKLIIPVEEELLSAAVLEAGKTNSYFIRFIIDYSIEKADAIRKIEEVEIILFDYKDYKDNPMALPLKLGNPKRMLSFADKYWKTE